MEAAERKILPLPRRRVTSLTNTATVPASDRQPVTPNLLFSRLNSLNNEVKAISQALSDDREKLQSDNLSIQHETHNVQEEATDFDDSEEEDDECTGCRDWLDNVKNKKKRKIPTSAVMGHTNTNSSPVQQVYGLGTSPGRSLKSKTRRRRTWDVSSESRPDASLRSGISSQAPAVFPDSIHGLAGLLSKDFDFTCDSPVSRNLPAPPPAPVEILPSEPVSVATQTTPTLAAMDPILPPRHRRSKEEKAYDRQRILAKQRREARAKLKPGEKETVWICQFCEFESIFGYAPLALINGYTERVRAAKRAALERKRLLEKARSKGKKKKKNVQSKSMPNNAPSPPLDNKITPTHQNGGKTGIDKAIGPGSTSCTCCDHRRDKEDRRHHNRYARAVPTPPPAAAHHHHAHHHHHHEHNHDLGTVDLPRDSATEYGSQVSSDEILL